MQVSPDMTAQLTASPTLEKQIWHWQGHRIAYTVQGTGQPLVLIHGFGASIGHWRKNIPVLAAAGYEVHALDLLGFGDSDKPPLNYTVELWEALLQDYWRDRLNQPTVFVGNSIGGLLTLMLLAHAPDMARAGVLLNCAGGLNHRPEELNPPLRLVMGTFSKVVSSPWLGPVVFNEVRRKFRIRGSLRQVYRNRAAITDDLVELLYRPSCDPGAQKVFAAILSAPPGPRPVDLLPHIKQPLLVLWGENDPWTPIQGAQVYRDLSATPDIDPPVTFQTIPNTGHCPHDERPEVVNPLIIDWLQTL
ncbi:MAG TPA: alpha/beta fold hydrolase [Candidatus Obscuribacterales bacterium]